MKAVLTAVVVWIAGVGFALAVPKSSLEYEGLVGPVQKVETRSPSLTDLGRTQSERRLKLDDIKIFDRAGNLVELQEFRWNGALRVRQVIAYDSRGYQSELIEYRPDGTVNTTLKGDFDVNRNMYLFTVYNSDGSAHFKSTTLLDNDGNIVEVKAFRLDGTLIKMTISTYGPSGKMIRQKGFYADRLFSKVFFKYDIKGHLRERTFHWMVGKKHMEHTRFQYDFDSRGNWISRVGSRRTRFSDGEEIIERDEITRRVISYFD